MILQRCSSLRSCILKKYLLKDVAICRVAFRIQEYTGFSTLIHHSNVPKSRYNTLTCQNLRSSLLLPAKWYSNGFVDGDVTELQNENELKKISELFPEARVTLHIISQRSPDKIYDVHFKQYMPGKKAIRNHEWTCIYKFVWPEKMKFEGTAISKRVAAEKAAIRALHWLYKNGRIDRKGQVIYDKKVLEELKTNLNEPVHANISEKSVERIQKIWSDYENGIREIYERAAVKAKLKALEAPALITKDSTIDEQEEYPEEINVDEQLAGTPDLKGPVHPVYGRVITPPTQQTLKRRAEALDRVFEEYDGNITPLPIDQYSERIISSLQESRVSVIVGAAGCGKSTRVPAALLRHCRTGASVVVAEPRRVAALGLAERVAEEFGEQVGDSIGYQVRLKSKLPRPPAGSILYCTSGILLNRLHGNPGLVGCSHVIIDEAHERDVNTDVIMLLLKRAMKLNGDLKLLIMSATLDTKVFTEYFDSCPVVEVPGRTYPVDISYLEDVQKKFCLQLPDTLASSMREDGRPRLNITEVTEVIKAVDKREKEGAILAFLPGWAEIKYAKQLLDAHYAGSTLHLILPVHSRLSTTDQSKMFNPPTPGVRKIVLATNIAETSVTIPDIVHVVDSGVHKENRVRDYTGTASLETVWVSLAGAKQRCGRAGRVQPGHCYKLYTKEKESEFASHTTPEILRVPLEQTVLNCKTYAPELKAKDFLSQLPEPPSSKAIQYAVNELIDIGALTPSESLSPLGSLLSRLPCSPRAGLVLVRGVMASAALPAADVAAGSDADTDMFVDSHDRREEIRETKRKFNSTSDHLALHRIQHEFENRLHKTGSQTVDDWCDRHSLRKERLNYIKSVSSLYLRELIKTGIIDCNLELDDLNRFSDIDELSVATLFSGVGSLLITRKHVKTKGQLKTVNEVFTTTGERAHIASESVNYSLTKRTNKPTLLTYYGGHHSIERRALTVYKSSVISPQAVILFSTGPVDEIENDGEAEVLSLPRHKLKIYLPANQSEVLLKARQMLWATFNYHIDRDTKDLEYDDVTSANRFRIKLLNAICRMLVDANHDTAEGKSVDVFS